MACIYTHLPYKDMDGEMDHGPARTMEIEILKQCNNEMIMSYGAVCP